MEFAIRAAVGASPSQLVQVIAYEVFWITALGSGAGLLLSAVLIHFIVALNPTLFPRMQDVGVNWAGAAFTVTRGGIAIVGFGLPSMARTERFPIAEGLKSQRLESGSRGRKWGSQNTLISMETALAFTMVTATLLMIQTVFRMQSFDLGFNATGVLTARLPFSFSDYPTEERLHTYYRALLGSLAEQPGVSYVRASTALPLSGIRETIPVSVGNADPTSVPSAQVSAGYFAAMQIPIIRGREFTGADDERRSPVVMVDAAFGGFNFGAEDPVGKLIVVGSATSTSRAIVGVVGNVRQFGPRSAQEPMVYFPLLQRARWGSFLAIRARSASNSSLSHSFRHAASTVDRNLGWLRDGGSQEVRYVRLFGGRLRDREEAREPGLPHAALGPGLSRHRRAGVRSPLPTPAPGRPRGGREVPRLRPRQTARAASRD